MDRIVSMGPQGTVYLFGIKLVGFNSENLDKLLISVGVVLGILIASWLLRLLVRAALGKRFERVSFWARQGINLLALVSLVVGVASVWFNDPARLGTVVGLLTAGLAFALQKVVTSFAGYFVILRGKNFNVGDRIVMGGVRGDVVALSFMQTTIMEMGQPPSVQSADPAMWVKSRQYTGRIVTVPNSKIFDEAIYNYSREFDFIWEEISIPIPYRDDREAAERVLLEAARNHVESLEKLGEEEAREACRRFDALNLGDLRPKVYYRLTDNWLELTLRFIARPRGVRDLKDKMEREILAGLDRAGVGFGSSTIEITGLPTLRFRAESEVETAAGAEGKGEPNGSRGRDRKTAPGQA